MLWRLVNGYRCFVGNLLSPIAGYKRRFENGGRSFLRNAGKHLQNYTFSPYKGLLVFLFCKPVYQSDSSYFLTYSTESNCSSLSYYILLHKSGTSRHTQTARRLRPTRILQPCCFQHGTPQECNKFMPTSLVTVI
jgi:hypothetical protein